MSSTRPCLSTLLLAAIALPAAAQRNDLVFVLPNALGQGAQFGIDQQLNIDLNNEASLARLGELTERNDTIPQLTDQLSPALNTALATQLATLPIASPASGVIFREDAATGALLPSSDSLGPILTERAETIGRGNVYIGFTRQQFRFNKIEGNPLSDFRALEPGGDPRPVSQFGVQRTTAPTTTGAQLDFRIDQNVTFFTYGVTDRLDVSAALTWVNARVGAVAFDGRIHNSGDPRPAQDGTCWCVQTFDRDLSRNSFPVDFGRSGFVKPGPYGLASGQSTGIGDTMIRAKATVFERPNMALAVGGDVRLPTGDELNYHGAGAAGFKPFAALSLHSKDFGGVRVSPHFNVGYQFNGDSVLAGNNVTAGDKGSLPNVFSWSVGTTISASRRLTLVADILGMTLMDSPRLVQTTISARGNDANAVGVPDARGLALTQGETFSMTNGAFGIKLKVSERLVLQYNVLVSFDDNSLRDSVVPLVGLGYTF